MNDPRTFQFPGPALRMIWTLAADELCGAPVQIFVKPGTLGLPDQIVGQAKGHPPKLIIKSHVKANTSTLLEAVKLRFAATLAEQGSPKDAA